MKYRRHAGQFFEALRAGQVAADNLDADGPSTLCSVGISYQGSHGNTRFSPQIFRDPFADIAEADDKYSAGGKGVAHVAAKYSGTGQEHG